MRRADPTRAAPRPAAMAAQLPEPGSISVRALLASKSISPALRDRIAAADADGNGVRAAASTTRSAAAAAALNPRRA
jgi:hypothetical protein